MSRLFAFSSRAQVRRVVFGLTAALLLTGCQSGSTPGGSPSETSSTTASPTSGVLSPGPSASGTAPPAAVYKPADAKGKAQNVPVPVMPELAKENSQAGLEAFIRYWYEQLNYSYETGETGTLRSLVAPTCTLCASLRDGIEDGWNEGRWVAGAGIRSAAVEIEFNSESSSQIAIIQVIQEAIEIRNADGSLYQDPTPATNSASRAALEFADERWVLADLGLIR